MRIKTLACLVLLAAFAVPACSVYTGVAVKDKKAYLSNSDASVEVCDVGAGGKLSNCRVE